MKQFTSILCALVIAMSAVAAPRVAGSGIEKKQVTEIVKVPALKLEKKDAQSSVKRVQSAKADAALTSGTYYTTGGKFYINNSDATSYMSSIEVTVDGNNVSIVGLAYWFKTAAIQGTMDGNTITFPSGQLLGSDNYGDEYLVGSNDASTTCDIVFNYNPETQTLTASTMYIIESSKADAIAAYAWWLNAVFSAQEPETPEQVLVELPEGATVVEYKMEYINPKDETAGSKYINVAVVDDKVYFQGMSQYLPDAWVVGTKDGNTITFEANQYVGDYGYYGSSYFFYSASSFTSVNTFTYDSEADKYSAEGVVFGLLDDSYYDGRYKNPILSKAAQADLDHPEEVAITSADGQYSSYYSDIVYTLQNATGDSIFVFDINLPSNQTDVTLDETYTLDNMYTNVSYTYAQIGETKTALKTVEFVKSKNAQGLPHIEATVVDNDLKVYHLVYDFKVSGEEVDLFFDSPMSVPQYYEDGAWEVYHKTISGDTVVAFVYYSTDATSPAGTFTESNLLLQSSGIVLDGSSLLIMKANITVTDNDERTDITATVIAANGVQYNIKMFFLKPVASSQETITSDAMTIEYISYYGVALIEASDDNNTIEMTINVTGSGIDMLGDYVAGTDFNGAVTPAGSETAIEIFSGTITIGVTTDGSITITGTVLCTNNVEYTLNLARKPTTQNLEMTTMATTEGTGYIYYRLSSSDYMFGFKITLAEGQEDVELGKTYTFSEDMGADQNSSWGRDYSTYDYIDYSEATFTKTINGNELRIAVTIIDAVGNIWNLTYTEEYVETAVDNVNAATKAVKSIENGQLIINVNGVRYNAVGATIR